MPEQKPKHTRAVVQLSINGVAITVEGEQEIVSKAIDFAMQVGAAPIAAALQKFAKGQ